MSKPGRKEHPISFRMPREDVELIDHAAALRGSSRTEFVRDAAVRQAEEVLLERSLVRMAPATFRDFVQAVDAPGRKVPELVKAFRRKSPWE